MGGPQRLGWSGWLGPSPSDKPVVGMRFEPERYARQLMRMAARSPEIPEKDENEHEW
jgi:type VI secretion system protein ImpH